ncbi:MAG: TIGR02996 domain-containing protein [Myxococcota bacterium]|nr:TIGR02996 domain-containing protein [Myxococcota bacterium]
MASLLVYVEGARLDELLPESAAGDTWLLGPETFAQPQLERLDEHSWLFIVSGTRCVAVLRNPRIHNGAFMGGAALVSNKDISQVLMRLGCTDGNVAAWAAIPRVLPPSDLDLLRYELGIADEEDVDEVLPDDDRTRELRAAIWDDPLSDDARMVYADYLQDRGDPRGELVALQVSRARSGDFESDRERLLVRRISPDCAQPLTPYLVPGFELVRGFVGKCTVNDTPMPEAITWHQAWRTVDDLSTTNLDLLVSPHVRAKRVGVAGRQLVLLVDHMRPLPFETVVGIAPHGKSQRGVWLEEGGWDRVAAVGALENVTTISVNPDYGGIGARLIPLMLRGPFGQRLRHVDAFIGLQLAEAQRWREAFDYGSAALLTLRFVVLERVPDLRRWGGPEVLVGLRRTARAPHLIVQVADLLDAESVTTVMRFVAQLSRNIQHAELHDFGAPRGQRIEDRHGTLLERMNAMFPQVLVQPVTAKPLAP